MGGPIAVQSACIQQYWYFRQQSKRANFLEVSNNFVLFPVYYTQLNLKIHIASFSNLLVHKHEGIFAFSNLNANADYALIQPEHF